MFHILVVEDDTNARKLMKAVLERAEFSVSTAADGESALALLDTRHVDLIVLDVMMPRMDGYALTGELRAVHGVLPATLAAAEAGRQLVLPAPNSAEAALVSNADVRTARTLLEVCAALRGQKSLPAVTNLRPIH